MKKLLISLILCCNTVFALPNPASVNCSQMQGRLIMIGSTGICLFKDNTYCEEWAFMRGTCQAGAMKFPGKFRAKKIRNYCILRVNNQVIVQKCKKH